MRWWRTADEAGHITQRPLFSNAPGFDTCTTHRLPIRGRNSDETRIARTRYMRTEEESGAGLLRLY
jgi:hypothetical protein